MENGPRILLHIGMPKAGSTALQFSLTRMAPELGKRGVLYPAVGSSAVSHKFLAFRLRDDNELPRNFSNIHDGKADRKEQSFRKDWDDIKRQVARLRPHTLVLSTEHLFSGFTNGRGAELKAALQEVSSDIHIVAYVRKPSDYYLSSVQQQLKDSSVMRPPRPISYQESLTQCEQLFSPAAVHVIAFERGQLKDGDIARDFLQRFLPDIDPALHQAQIATNESISAEGMAIMQDYRAVNHAGRDGYKSSDTKKLLNYIRRIEARHDLHRRPTLLPDIRAWLDSASTDIEWLKQRHGVVFSGVDYTTVAACDNPHGDLSRVHEICEMDAQRRTELQMRIASAMLTPRLLLPFPMMVWLEERQDFWLARLLSRVLGLKPLKAG